MITFDNDFFREINRKYLNTHMPFIYYKKNEPEMVFCILKGKRWKLVSYNKKTSTCERVLTNANGLTNECNPAVWVNEDNTLNMTYTHAEISNAHSGNDRYCMVLRNVKSFTKPKKEFELVQEAMFSTLTKKFKIIGSYQGKIEIYDFESNQLIKSLELNDKYVLTRIAPVTGNDNLLLISWADNTNPNSMEVGSLMYNLETDEQKDIFVLETQESPYKPSLDPYTNRLYYAKRISIYFEDRKICVSDNWTLKPSNLITVVEE